jgi:flagellar protein FlbD
MAEVIERIAAYRARIVTMAYGADTGNATGPQPTLAPVAPIHAAPIHAAPDQRGTRTQDGGR